MPVTPNWPHSFDLQAEGQKQEALSNEQHGLKAGGWLENRPPLVHPGGLHAHPKQYARPESTRPQAKASPMPSCSVQLSAPATFSGVALASKSMPVPSWPLEFEPQHHHERSSAS